MLRYRMFCVVRTFLRVLLCGLHIFIPQHQLTDVDRPWPYLYFFFLSAKEVVSVLLQRFLSGVFFRLSKMGRNQTPHYAQKVAKVVQLHNFMYFLDLLLLK